ncbi:MAG: hypothetical protein JSS66_06085 [Armatimonadetes bacterium]|nr:hypothetical protein [Armatimonadota bacterium]
MKKLFCVLAAAVTMVCGAFAQSNQLPIDAGTPKLKPGEVASMSSSFTMTEKGLDWLYLNDGFDNLAAISYTIKPIQGTNGRLRLQALGAADPSDMSKKAYLTMGLGYNLFNAANGFRLDLFAGPKGFNVADGFKFQSGKGAFVFGFGVTVPLGF